MSRDDEGSSQVPANGRPHSAKLAAAGVNTASDFARLMSGLLTDVLSGEISPGICNAAVNAGGKLLKVVEMQHRYGKTKNGEGPKDLTLCAPAVVEVDQRVDRIAAIEQQLAELKGDLAG
jgi:hypothetical protein